MPNQHLGVNQHLGAVFPPFLLQNEGENCKTIEIKASFVWDYGESGDMYM